MKFSSSIIYGLPNPRIPFAKEQEIGFFFSFSDIATAH